MSYISLGLPTGKLIPKKFIVGETLSGFQHKRDNQSGSMGSGWCDCSRPDHTDGLVLVSSEMQRSGVDQSGGPVRELVKS